MFILVAYAWINQKRQKQVFLGILRVLLTFMPVESAIWVTGASSLGLGKCFARPPCVFETITTCLDVQWEELLFALCLAQPSLPEALLRYRSEVTREILSAEADSGYRIECLNNRIPMGWSSAQSSL